jgi:hypothetical protein
LNAALSRLVAKFGPCAAKNKDVLEEELRRGKIDFLFRGKNLKEDDPPTIMEFIPNETLTHICLYLSDASRLVGRRVSRLWCDCIDLRGLNPYSIDMLDELITADNRAIVADLICKLAGVEEFVFIAALRARCGWPMNMLRKIGWSPTPHRYAHLVNERDFVRLVIKKFKITEAVLVEGGNFKEFIKAGYIDLCLILVHGKYNCQDCFRYLILFGNLAGIRKFLEGCRLVLKKIKFSSEIFTADAEVVKFCHEKGFIDLHNNYSHNFSLEGVKLATIKYLDEQVEKIPKAGINNLYNTALCNGDLEIVKYFHNSGTRHWSNSRYFKRVTDQSHQWILQHHRANLTKTLEGYPIDYVIGMIREGVELDKIIVLLEQHSASERPDLYKNIAYFLSRRSKYYKYFEWFAGKIPLKKLPRCYNRAVRGGNIKAVKWLEGSGGIIPKSGVAENPRYEHNLDKVGSQSDSQKYWDQVRLYHWLKK